MPIALKALPAAPMAIRVSDGHLFIGRGNAQAAAIDEFDAAGALVRTIITADQVESLSLDQSGGRLYYADYGSQVRVFDLSTGADTLVATSSGTIDGGLAFDPISGLLFVGTANGANAGRVETINLQTGAVSLFASGFGGATGILRDAVTGSLYFLDGADVSSPTYGRLYRLGNANVNSELGVPEPGAAAMLIASVGLVRRRLRRS